MRPQIGGLARRPANLREKYFFALPTFCRSGIPQSGTKATRAACVPASLEVAHFKVNKSARMIAYSLPVFGVQSNHMTTMKTQKTPVKTNQEKALATFVNRTQACRDLAAKINAHLEDHMGEAPEDVTWGNVGDAAHIQMLLEQICDFAQINTAGVDRITPVEE